MNSKIDELFRRVQARNKMRDRVELKAQESQLASSTGHTCPAVSVQILAEDCRKHQLMVSGVCSSCNFKSVNA